MEKAFDAVIQPLRDRYRDTRFNIFDVTAAQTPAGLKLSGRVLDGEMLEALRIAFSGQPFDDSDVQVLRSQNPLVLTVATNLTNLHAGPGWNTELLSQLLCGQRLELLAEDGNWVYARQVDGYLGWAYRPYLTAGAPLEPTHLVTAPRAALYDQPDGPLQGFVLGGSFTAMLERQGAWARISVFDPREDESSAVLRPGWARLADLRERAQLPPAGAALRAYLLEVGHTFLGVPYLWGGSSANGIDCSGLAQLLHRYAGLDLPRDSDLQCLAARPVDAPFRPGDLVFFGDVDTRRVTHVGISTGGWDILHSSRRRNGVYADNIQQVSGLRETFLCGAAFLD